MGQQDRIGDPSPPSDEEVLSLLATFVRRLGLETALSVARLKARGSTGISRVHFDGDELRADPIPLDEFYRQ